MKFTRQDQRFMRRALALARRGLGKTSPNPAVGAVLVKGGRVIAEDYHKRAGGPHAEVFVFRKAKKRARGATLYVTMEPCCTWGKTPPCTDAIIAAGVKRVVVAAVDLNPHHNRRGLKILRRTGIRVESGLLADESERMNDVFNKWIATKMPFVIAKAAMSLDGKISTRTGDSKWITNEAARREGHKLRAMVDAVMIAAGTVRRDNPQLTVRHRVRGKQPLRIVVDARGRSLLSAKLFSDKHRTRTIVVTTTQSSTHWRETLAKCGVQVMTAPRDGQHVNLRAMLKALGRHGVTSVLVEGGGDFLGAMFEASLVDKVALFYAPIVIGGREAVTAADGAGVARVKTAWRFTRNCQWRKIGKDTVMFVGNREPR